MIEIYDNFFSKELVEGFFDLKIKIKFNLLRDEFTSEVQQI